MENYAKRLALEHNVQGKSNKKFYFPWCCPGDKLEHLAAIQACSKSSIGNRIDTGRFWNIGTKWMWMTESFQLVETI